jgi:uncharacterized protein (DUF924 family)
VCRKALTDKKWLSKFKRAERFALLMPLAMAENEKDLILAKELIEKELEMCDDKDAEFRKRFNAIHDLAVNYRGCMISFGRLPFRNEVLGRKST